MEKKANKKEWENDSNYCGKTTLVTDCYNILIVNRPWEILLRTSQETFEIRRHVLCRK